MLQSYTLYWVDFHSLFLWRSVEKRSRLNGTFWTTTVKEVPALHNNLDVLHVSSNPAKSRISYCVDVWFLSSVFFSLLGASCCVFTGLEGLGSRELMWGEDANCPVKAVMQICPTNTVFYQMINAAGKAQVVTPNGKQVRHPLIVCPKYDKQKRIRQPYGPFQRGGGHQEVSQSLLVCQMMETWKIAQENRDQKH